MSAEQERAQALEQELRDLAAALSHDLRAPLRALDGFSQVLLEQYGQVIDEQGQQYLRFIRDGAIDFGRQLTALVELLRLTTGELRPTRVDLGGLARDALAALRAAEPGRKVDVTIADGLVATGDTRLLRTLVGGLVDNAWKFTRRRADARIAIGRGEDAGQQVIFVRDNGVGFDMAYAARLFQPFGRLHASADGSGMGMGLARARRVVLRHGGRLLGVGAPDAGATFSFTLGEPGAAPVAPDPALAP
jgi:signal transduction histidine kinase